MVSNTSSSVILNVEYFHETDEDINKKAKAIIANGVTPIICCGETLETYEAGKTAEWVEGQITAALKDLTPEQVSNLVIAYEPILGNRYW